MDRREGRTRLVRKGSGKTRGTVRGKPPEQDTRCRVSGEERDKGRQEMIHWRPSQKEIEKARRERMKRKAEARRRAEEKPEARRIPAPSKTRGSRPETSRSSSRDRLSRPSDHEPKDRPGLSKKAGTRKARKAASLRTRVILAAAGVLAVLAVLSFTVLFPVQEIRVEGETRYSEEEIVAASGIEREENLFLTGRDGGALIQKALPYVGEAVIRKKLPSTIVIEVSETTPMYCVKQDGKWYILDARLKLLEMADKQPKKLVVLKGLLIDTAEIGEKITFFEASKVKSLEELSLIFLEYEITGITGIVMENSLDVRLQYEDRLVIKLGIPNELGTKVRHAMAVIREKLGAKDKGMIDVSSGKSATYNPNYDPKSKE